MREHQSPSRNEESRVWRTAHRERIQRRKESRAERYG
jgi:hypothetical protein